MHHQRAVQTYFKDYYLDLADKIKASEESKKFIEQNYQNICQGNCYVPWTKAEKERAAKRGIFL